MKRILAAALSLVSCSAVHAHDEGGHSHWWLDLDTNLGISWYAGAGFGQSRYDDYEVADDGSFTARNGDDSGTVRRFFGGMGIGKYAALELGYADFGEATFRAQSDGSGSFWNAGPQAVKVTSEAYDLSLIGRVPLTESWGLFAKLIWASWESEAPVSLDAQCCGTLAGTFSDDGRELTYGVGAHYDGLSPVRIIGEYGVLPFEPEYSRDTTLDWIAISVAYLF